MRWSQAFIPTLREVPQEAEVVSHQLMLRAGLIQKLSSGLYTFLPLGLRVLRKVEGIIREELNKRGAQELLMPILQPRALWEQSGRWDIVGDLAMKTKSREEKEFILGPTHEEVVTDIIAKMIQSYRHLPVNLYQIQTKFRDELRPRFGVMRAKEFVMKDGYSFDSTDDGAEASYQAMFEAYNAIFSRCGLKFKAIEADTGVMGGHKSQEFMVLADSGEDGVILCEKCGYAANLELATRKPKLSPRHEPFEALPLKKVPTPGMKTVKEVTKFFKAPAAALVKTLIYEADGKPVAVLVRGDLELSEIKLRRFLGAKEVRMAGESVIQKVTGAPLGFSGPVGLNAIRVVGDLSVQGMSGAITGANEPDAHYQGVDIARDCKVEEFADLATAIEEDHCALCGGVLALKRGIEVGHVFKLGTKYSKSMGAVFLDPDGKSKPAIMGCYGIGVSRTVAAVIEQNYDESGICWPVAVAPYTVVVTIVNVNDAPMKAAGEKIYADLAAAGIEVLLDDRDERPGPKFKDADLIGIPYRITVGKHISSGQVELKSRRETEPQLIHSSETVSKIRSLI